MGGESKGSDEKESLDDQPSNDWNEQEWTDLTPIPQDEGSHPLVVIAYTPGYAKMMGLFRACIQTGEQSARCLRLSSAILAENPSHYSVWRWRVQVLQGCPQPPRMNAVQWWRNELDFILDLAQDNPKSYQIWRHRQLIVEQLVQAYKRLDTISDSIVREGVALGEITFINGLLEIDAKNYHAWSYRQWVIGSQFIASPSLWEGELAEIDSWIALDVYNNSAWNHRHFWWSRCHGTVFCEPSKSAKISTEVDYILTKIDIAPDNQSAWSYLRGFCALANISSTDSSHRKRIGDLVAKYCDIHVVPALIFQTQWIDKSQDGALVELQSIFEVLQTVDPIRCRYWDYRLRHPL